MAKSDLLKFELSGILRKIKILNILDAQMGIINKEYGSINKVVKSGLDTFRLGGYDEQYGLSVMNSIIEGNGVKAVSATRDKGTATFVIRIISVFNDIDITVKYPHGGYK